MSRAAELAAEAVEAGVPEPPVAYQAGVIALADGERREGRRLLKSALQGQVELTAREVEHARALLDGHLLVVPARLDCTAYALRS